MPESEWGAPLLIPVNPRGNGNPMRILLVPLDDRPITYGFPQLLLKAAQVEAIVPPRPIMGSLNRGAQIDELFSFCENALSKSNLDAVILCLDSLLYGGLITSRRSSEDLKTISDRLERIKKWKTLSSKPIPFYAQSSIMRISDNYDNTEEKDYWSTYGKELFEWSACMHRISRGEKLTAGVLESLERKIPGAIRQDYQSTRFRNFSINMLLLRSMKARGNSNFLDYLVFSQDDSGAWGLNVSEKERILKEVDELKLGGRVTAYAGADEVIMTLISRALIDNIARTDGTTIKPHLQVKFSPAGAAAVASRYEGQELGVTVQAQLEASAVKYTYGDDEQSNSEDNFTFVVHGPQERQGDHITLPGLPDLSNCDTRAAVQNTIKILEESAADCIIADVAYANGGDPLLMEALLKNQKAMSKVKSYAGWNTSGNTIGSAIAMATCLWYARHTVERSDTLKHCLYTRLLDDWAYQSKVRKTLGGETSTQKLAESIAPYVKTISAAVNMEPGIRLSFPWRRTFEIEIGFEGG